MCVPRVNLTSPDNSEQHIRFTRRQLPLRLAYCMTINKAQGQTFHPPFVCLKGRTTHNHALILFQTRPLHMDGAHEGAHDACDCGCRAQSLATGNSTSPSAALGTPLP